MKCIIIDDDKITQKTLEAYIQKRPELKLIGQYNDAVSAIPIIKSETVDLIFLDVVMPNMSGLDLMEYFSVLPQVIIVSDYKEYAVDGFNYNVTDFLTKPITQERFSGAIDKVFQRAAFEKVKNESYHTISVKQRSGYINISTDDILYIEGFGDYVNVYLTEGKKVTVLSTIKGMEEELSAYNFMRIHRSYIVNLSKVERVIENDVHLKDQVIPVSRTYRSTLMQLFKDKQLG